jgi:hypothetical protein
MQHPIQLAVCDYYLMNIGGGGTVWS